MQVYILCSFKTYVSWRSFIFIGFSAHSNAIQCRIYLSLFNESNVLKIAVQLSSACFNYYNLLYYMKYQLKFCKTATFVITKSGRCREWSL